MYDKTVLVVGASGGIGSALINCLRMRDYRVVTTSSNSKKTETNDHFFVDLTEFNSVKSLKNKLADTKVDLVIINSGVSKVELFEEKTYDQIKREFSVNLVGPVCLLKTIFGHLSESAAIVVNSSINAYLYTPNMTTYCSSKSGITAFAETLRHECKGRRIISMITPPVETEMAISATEQLNRKTVSELKQRYLDPEVYSRWVLDKIEAGHNGTLIHPSARILLFLNRIFPRLQDKIYEKMFD